MRRTCRVHGRDEKFTQNLGHKISWEEIIWETKMQITGNIKLNDYEIWCENMEGIQLARFYDGSR